MFIAFIFSFTFVCISYIMLGVKLHNNIKIVLNCLLILFFSLIIAYRPITVPDTYSYIELYRIISVFQKYPIINFMVNEFDSEIGYILFCQVIKFIFGNSVTIFLFLIPVINISFIMYTSNKLINTMNIDNNNSSSILTQNNYFQVIFLLYTSYFGFLYNGITLRASIALSLSICSLIMFIDKKYLKMILFLCLAFAFHRIAFISILIILIFHAVPRFKRISYLFLWLFIGIIMFLHVSDKIINTLMVFTQSIFSKIYFLSSFNNYLMNYSQNVQFGFAKIFFYVIGIIFLLWKVDNDIYYKFINIYFSGLILTAFMSNMYGASRISDFFTIYSIFLFFILYKYSKTRVNIIIFSIFAFAIIGNLLALRVWGLL